MSREAFNRITQFSTEKKLSKLEERILYHKYQEDFYMFVDGYIKNNSGTNPPPDTIVGFNTTLLSDMTLSTNINLASAELESFNKKELERLKFTNGLKNFGLSTLSSVVGSFLFTLIIILLFLMGENQIKSWFSDKGNETKSNNTEIPIDNSKK